MTRDALHEALRELFLPTAAALLALAALPLVARSAVVVAERATLDGTLALTALLALLSALRLGTLLDGAGLSALLRPVLGDGPFLRRRIAGFTLALGAQQLVVLGAGLLLAPVRSAGPLLVLHGLGNLGEGLVALLLTAFVATWVRPWLGAFVAAAALTVGHLEPALVDALPEAVGPLLRLLLVAVPSFARLDVTAALLHHDAADPTVLAAGTVEMLAWLSLSGALLHRRWTTLDRG